MVFALCLISCIHILHNLLNILTNWYALHRCRMLNQRIPQQGSKSELEDVIANIASEAQALDATQAIEKFERCTGG